MSDNFWRRANIIIGLFPFGALFGMLVFVANLEIKDLDLWLHLAMGRFITLQGYVPSVDVLSCSIAGTSWINHEWLFQVIVYNIHHLWGPDGLIGMQIVVVLITMLLLLFLGYNKEKQLETAFLLCCVYLVYQQRFTIRPDIYSLLFLTIYIFVLSLHIDKKWAVVVLFIVQVLWSNMHGFFFFGPLFMFIGIISEWIKRNIKLPYEWNDSGRLTDDEYKRIKIIFVFVILACLFNPQGIRGAVYPIGVFFSLSGENKIFFEYIQELQKPVTWATLFHGGRYIYYKLLIFISIALFIFNRRRIDISALFFWGIFLVFSLKAIRNASYFAFAAYLVCITNLVNVSISEVVPIRFTAKKFEYLTLIVLKILLFIWIFQYFQGMAVRRYYDFEKYEHKSEFGGISLRNFPHKAVDFLVDNHIKGNFFNDFNSGAYLLGNTHPDIKVFMDGRTEVYGGRFFKEYRDIWENGNMDLFELYVKDFQITGALLNSARQFIPKKIINYLFKSEDWILVYFDYDAVIFLKDVEKNREIINKFTVDLSKWKVKKLNLYKIGAARTLPYQPYFRAYTLDSLGFTDSAIEEAEQALKIEPAYGDPYHLIGKIYAHRKEFKKAFEYFRTAAVIAPHSSEVRHNLALSYFDMGEYEGAIKQYEEIVAKWPRDIRGYFFLAKSYAKNEQYGKMMNTLKSVFSLNPKDPMGLIEMGKIMVEEERFKEAKQIYELALKTDKELAQLYEKLGDVCTSLEEYGEAKFEYERALSLDPDNEELKKKMDALKENNLPEGDI